MSVRKRKVNGQWVDIGQEVLKTDIVAQEVEIPSIILPGDDVLLVSEKMIYFHDGSNASNYIDTGIEITIPKTGTYNFKSSGSITNQNGTSYKARIIRNSSSLVEENIGSSGGYVELNAQNVSCQENDIIKVQITPSAYNSYSSYYGNAGALIAYIGGSGGSGSNRVKRKINGQWENFGSIPLLVPINKEVWTPKDFATGAAPWSDSLKNSYGTVGSITIPKTGNYTFKFGCYGSDGSTGTASYQLQKGTTTIFSGNTNNYVNNYSYTDNFSQGDQITLSYKCANYSEGWSTYAVGYCSPLVAHFND